MNKEMYEGWLRLYKIAHAIKSPKKYGYEKLKFPGEEFQKFLKKLDPELAKVSFYLNKNKIPMRPPKWFYDSKDPKTHASSPEFIYTHLL